MMFFYFEAYPQLPKIARMFYRTSGTDMGLLTGPGVLCWNLRIVKYESMSNVYFLWRGRESSASDNKYLLSLYSAYSPVA